MSTAVMQKTDRLSLPGLPKSCKVVYKILMSHGPLNMTRLTTFTEFSERTIRNAVRRLEKEGLVISRVDLRDMRLKFLQAVANPAIIRNM